VITAQLSALGQLDGFGPPVVLDGLALTLDILVDPLALLAKKRQLTGLGGHQAMLAAIGVFAHGQYRATDQNRALGQDHMPSPHADLLGIVITHGVGSHVYGLVAVGFLGAHPGAPQQQGNDQQSG
jgi:hypothetical protein